MIFPKSGKWIRAALGTAQTVMGIIVDICRALLAVKRQLGVKLPDEGEVRMAFDDSILTDITAEKRQDMHKLAAGLMELWGYRAKWYGEDVGTAWECARLDQGRQHLRRLSGSVPYRS